MKGCLGCLGGFVCLAILLMLIGTCADEPTYNDNTSSIEPVLTKDEKRFFWATLNVDGVVLAPNSEIMWAARYLAEQNMPDPEFRRFMAKIRRYKNFVIKHPDKVTPPAWAKGKM